MKLHNKDTGEDGRLMMCHDGDDYPLYIKIGEIRIYYHSFAEMVEAGWECSIEPAEPLIKDEKIRKAVRAWAEADDLDNFRLQNERFNCCKIIGYTAGINKASFISFQTTIAHADNKKLYTIAELCGEEKE